MIQIENVPNGVATAPATATTENANTDVVPPAVTESLPVAHSQPVEIPRRQLPHMEIKDSAKQEFKKVDRPTSASVAESTTMTDVVPSHVRKRTLDEYISVYYALKFSPCHFICCAVGIDCEGYFLLIE